MGDLAPECLARLEEDGLLVDVRPAWDEAGPVDGVDGYHALVVGVGVPVTAAVVAAGHALRVVGVAGVGVDGIDVAAATRRGIVVVHAPGRRTRLRGRARARAGTCVRPRPERRRRGPPRRHLVVAAAGRRHRGPAQDARARRAGPSSPLLAERARALGMTVLASDPRRRTAPPPARSTSSNRRACAPRPTCSSRPPAPRSAAAELAQIKAGVRVVALSGADVDAAALARALEDGYGRRGRRERRSRRRLVERPRRRAPLLFTSGAEASTADARRRAGVSVADQVAAVLRGRLLRGAVNVPAAAGDDADELMPYMGLCTRLGTLLVQLADEPVDAIEVTYGGSVAYYDTRLLTLGVLGGVLADRAGAPVNFVNAEVVAAELGVTAAETRQSGIPDFPRLITVAVAGTGGAMSVSGTSLGAEHKPRLVRVFGEDVDLEPASHMAVLRYVDAPGIGGKVGTLPASGASTSATCRSAVASSATRLSWC